VVGSERLAPGVPGKIPSGARFALGTPCKHIGTASEAPLVTVSQKPVRNVIPVEFRWADRRPDAVPVKASTATTPIVFTKIDATVNYGFDSLREDPTPLLLSPFGRRNRLN